MAKYRADHLKEMIRGVVREEVDRALREGTLKEIMAETIAEVLSERYLRQIAESAVGARPRGVSALPIMGDDEVDEDVPEPLENNILAPGQPNPIFKKIPSSKKVRQHVAEVRKPRVDVQGIASMFFEGTEPIDEREGRAEEGVPLPVDDVPEMAEQAQEWTRVLREANQRAEDKKPMQAQRDPASEEERLKKLREKLDQQVVRT